MVQENGAAVKPKRGGAPWALCLIVPCGCMAATVPLLYATLTPVFGTAREITRETSCSDNLRQQAMGARMYSEDYDEHLPPASTWMDTTVHYIKQDAFYHCPAASQPGANPYGYAYDKKLSRVSLATLNAPLATIMIYNSTNLARNATDEQKSFPIPGRHRKANNLAYADGHVNRTARPSMFFP